MKCRNVNPGARPARFLRAWAGSRLNMFLLDIEGGETLVLIAER